MRRTAALTSGLFDWRLLRFGSASLKNRIYRELIEGGLFWIPQKWRGKWDARYPVALNLDTAARCACAGFWLWYEKDADGAVEAFEAVQTLPHGTELHCIAAAIVSGLTARSLDDLSSWKDRLSWLQGIGGSELRPGTLDAIRILRDVATEASTAFYAQSALNRSAALGRAAAALQGLLETGKDSIPEPEWPLLQGLAEQWRTILVHAGGEAGQQVIREPTLNPYEGYSGLPVTGHTFVGRHDAIKQIETRWSTSNQLPVLILYGHRRMGKTSILRNLDQVTPANTLLVYLDMQDAGFVDHTGELLLDLAEALHNRTTAAGFDAGSPPDKNDYASLGEARRALNQLLARLDSQLDDGRRVILAVDEFELIEEGIDEGRIDPKLPAYLRALNQRHRWLALIFGGLHTLDEMGRDYKNAFYGQTENIRVGYLSHDDAISLITQPHPDFALEYAPALREQLYRLTFGQPYLLQRLCWELVKHWNEAFLKQGAKIPRMLELTVLEPVLNADFYKAAEHYFDGVWSNVTDDERALMTLIATRETGWTSGELTERKMGIDIDATLRLLKGHDVIIEDQDGIRFAAELLRRWVAR